MNNFLSAFGTTTEQLLGSLTIHLNNRGEAMLLRKIALLGAMCKVTRSPEWPYIVHIPDDYQIGDYILLFEVFNRYPVVTVRKKNQDIYIDLQ